jgi:hypothetical protein
MPVLRLETPEATFTNNMRGEQHFMLDCACKGKGGNYHGSHYKNGTEDEVQDTRDYEPRYGSQSDHTFYLSELIFSMILENHRESKSEPPLIIVCNDCSREFPFTHESYFALKDEMFRAYGSSDIKRELRREAGKGIAVVNATVKEPQKTETKTGPTPQKSRL